ncbi:MAG: phage tape measure protein [Lachnospiraceae bacterium]|jgi:tape measure domain-containing protein|nr:phage tape measure protein [Lachnospiraceae bacterium]
MPSLNAMFKILNGYSRPMVQIIQKTDEATNKILKASGATDNLNSKMKNAGAGANVLSSGLGKVISIAALAATTIKGMNIADEYTNTSARLNLINDGLQTQAELQEKIFDAANRSKGSYTAMAGAISKMGITASEAFGSNDELIAFTELIQKGFKVGGASTTEQQSAIMQLTQAMGAGKLQGDEFRSIMENAPMIADAIAKYTGKSKGELKELSSEGLITSDIIKNAMFMAADDINSKFETMPMTFGDAWNRIKNGSLEAFAPVIESVNRLINTDGFMNGVNNILIGIGLISSVVGGLIDFIVAGWDLIGPFVIAAAIAGIMTLTGHLWAMLVPVLAHIKAWAILNAPMILTIAIILLIIHTLKVMGVTVEDIFGFIGGVVGITIAGIWNLFFGLFELVLGILNFWTNKFVIFANFFANVFQNPISSVIYLFQGLADNVLGVIEKIASALDFVFGSKMAETVSSWRSGLKEMADAAVAKYAPNENYQKIMETVNFGAEDFGFKRMEYGAAWDKGNSVGKDLYGGIADKLSGLTDMFSKDSTNMDDFGSNTNPLSVVGTGSGGKVDVDMSDEDLKYMRDIAERDYINKFSTATLAPNIQVTFGDVHETADTDAVTGRIKAILQEEIATASEGVYDV